MKHRRAQADADDSRLRTLRFRDWATLRYSLVWAYEGPVLAKARVGTYSNPDLSCWLVRKGSVQLTTRSQTVVAKKGQWAFVATPTRRQVFSDDAEILSVHVHFSWPGDEPVIEQKRNLVFDAAEHPQLERAAVPLARTVKKLFPKADAFLPEEWCSLAAYLQVQDQLPRWLHAYLAAQAAHGVFPRRLGVEDDRVLGVLGELDRRPLEAKFNEKEIVARSGLGRSQLNALFVRVTGTTPRRYFERRRLEAARRLLGHTALSMKEVAATLGFRHESHFSQWFKGCEGAAPSAWRLRAGKRRG